MSRHAKFRHRALGPSERKGFAELKISSGLASPENTAALCFFYDLGFRDGRKGTGALDAVVWSFRENRIAVRFAYEWHDDSGNWFRSYGNENWEFNERGFMMRRFASMTGWDEEKRI